MACGNSPPQSSQTVADLCSNLKYPVDFAMEGKPSFIAKINCEDLVLEQIVDDVDNMYRWESILLAIMSKNSTNILDIVILDIPKSIL